MTDETRETEDRLRAALHEHADPIEPTPGSWERISARFDGRARARRPRALALVAAALCVIVLAAAVVAVRSGGEDGDDRVATGEGRGATAMPDLVVAITDARDLVVMDARTGEVVHTLAAGGLGAAGGIPALAVAPDGGEVFVTGQMSSPCPDSLDIVLRVSVADAKRSIAATGPAVALSADGRDIATTPVSDCSGPASIEVRPEHDARPNPRVDGSVRVTDVGGAATDLSFAPDGRRVAYTQVPPGQEPETSIVDLATGASERMRAWSDAVGPYTFRGRTGELVGVHDGVRITRADPEARRFLPDLARSPVSVAGAVRSDPTGDHLLWTGTDGALYHWHASDGIVRRTTGGILAATWLPAPAASELASGPPSRFVVARGEGLVEVLGADGSVAGWSPGGRVDGVSVTADGRDLLVAHQVGGRCSEHEGSSQPRIDRIDRDAGRSTRIVGGASSPVVSPDGRFVAYGIECDGIELGLTNLRTGENYRPEFLSPEGYERRRTRVEPLGWSPDSRQVVYRVTFADGDPPGYFAGAFAPVVAPADERLGALPWEHGLTAATFVGDDEVAIAHDGPDGSVVRTWRLGSGKDLDDAPVRFRLRESIRSLVADPTGRHLLVLTGDGTLSRWSVGDRTPTKLTDGVTAAAWLGGG